MEDRCNYFFRFSTKEHCDRFYAYLEKYGKNYYRESDTEIIVRSLTEYVANKYRAIARSI